MDLGCVKTQNGERAVENGDGQPTLIYCGARQLLPKAADRSQSGFEAGPRQYLP
jgi:hypothetical protein